MTDLGLKFIATLTLVLIASTCRLCARQRSLEEVIEIIETRGVELMNDETFEKGFRSKSFSRKAAQLVASTEIDGLNQNSDLPAFYVYSPSQDGGFLVVSADRRMTPVLAYSDRGRLDTHNLPDNVRGWLATYVTQAQNINRTVSKSIEIAGDVAPLVTTRWNQSSPYNLLCPVYSGNSRSVAGCAAITMAQVMNYHRHPDVGRGTNSYVSRTYGFSLSRDFSTVGFNWSAMKDSYDPDDPNADVIPVADLLLTCGIAVDMDYGPVSSANELRMLRALVDNFGYDPDIHFIRKDLMPPDLWHSGLVGELRARRPVIMTGVRSSGYGHAFIVDGYQSDPADYPYYHVNWGWGGIADGYYKMTNLSESGDPANAYNQNLSAIINIRPDDNSAGGNTFVQLESLYAGATTVDVSKNRQLTVDILNFINCGYDDFRNSLLVCLVDSAGKPTAIFSKSFDSLPTNHFYSETQLPADIPATLPSGTYVLKAYTQSTPADTLVELPLRHAPDTITLLNDPTRFRAALMATEINFSHSTDGRISLTASDLRNFRTEDFCGTLQMIVTDRQNNTIAPFGSHHTIDRLAANQTHPIPLGLSGTLPDPLPDGAYRLRLGANRSGYTNHTPVDIYTLLADGRVDESDIDAHTDFWIIDNSATFTKPYLDADVNLDNTVDRDDFLALADLILSNHTTPGLTLWAADLNQDDALSVADMSLLAGLLNGNDQTARPAIGRSFLNPTDVAAYKGREVRLPLRLNTSANVTDLQFDLLLPGGLTIAQIDVADTHRVMWRHMTDGTVRVIVSSADNTVLTPADGTVATLRLHAPDTVGAYGISLRNIILANPGSSTKAPAATSVVQIVKVPADINNDGQVNSADAIAIYNYINNSANSPNTLGDVDLNRDNIANSADVILIYNHIASE